VIAGGELKGKIKGFESCGGEGVLADLFAVDADGELGVVDGGFSAGDQVVLPPCR